MRAVPTCPEYTSAPRASPCLVLDLRTFQDHGACRTEPRVHVRVATLRSAKYEARIAEQTPHANRDRTTRHTTRPAPVTTVITNTKTGGTSCRSINPLKTAPSGAATTQARAIRHTLAASAMFVRSNAPNHGATNAHAARNAPIVTSNRPVWPSVS